MKKLHIRTVAVLCIAWLGLSGCSEGIPAPDTNAKQSNDLLPTNAQNVQPLGNGWIKFELDGHHFLFRRTTYIYSAAECIVEIKP